MSALADEHELDMRQVSDWRGRDCDVKADPSPRSFTALTSG